jgi:hypothetical protein
MPDETRPETHHHAELDEIKTLKDELRVVKEQNDKMIEALDRAMHDGLSVEERAREYEKLMAEGKIGPDGKLREDKPHATGNAKRDQGEPGQTGPVPPPHKTEDPRPPKKDWFFGDRLTS